MRMQTHYVYEALNKQPSNGQVITHKLHTQRQQSHTYPVAHHNANQCRGYMYEFNNFTATEAGLPVCCLLVPKSTTWSLGGGFGRNVNHITTKRYNVWGMRLFIASHCHSSNNNNYFDQAHTHTHLWPLRQKFYEGNQNLGVYYWSVLGFELISKKNVVYTFI